MALSISSQLERLEKQIEDRLGHDGLLLVADTAIEVAKTQVQKTVYDAYEPAPPEKGGYERTYKLQNDWLVSSYTPLTIGIASNRWDEGVYVSEIVETGEGYSISGNYPYEVPRPFVKNTADELRDTKEHVYAYAEALRRAGFKVRVK